MTFATEMVGLGGATAISLGGLYSAVTATGTNAANAAPIVTSMVVVAGADGTKGVLLPDGQDGDLLQVFNNSGSTLKVWPTGTDAITVPGTGLGSPSAAFSHLTYKEVKYKYFKGSQVDGQGQWVVNVTS